VILVFYGNDLHDVTASESGSVPKPRFLLNGDELVLTGVPIPAQHAERFTGRYDPGEPRKHPLQHSHLFNLVDRGVPKLLHRGPAAISPEAPELATRLILAIRELASERGARLHLAVLESRSHAEAVAELERRLAREGVPFVALPPRNFPQRHLWQDGHFNARGHRDLAQALHAQLATGLGGARAPAGAIVRGGRLPGSRIRPGPTASNSDAGGGFGG
jgi:hypothetical protein